MQGEELIEIGARRRWWFVCCAFGVGRREINMLNDVRFSWSVITGDRSGVGGDGAGFGFGCGVFDVGRAYVDVV